MGSQLLTSIIIVTFNNLEYTKDCVDHVFLYTDRPYELIIVDNNSTDSTKKWLEKLSVDKCLCQGVITKFNQENTGFARAVNQGLEIARGEYVFLLNNDLILTKEWLSHLLAHFTWAPGAGIVGPIGSGLGGVQDYVQFYGYINYKYPPDNNLQQFAGEVYRKYQGHYTEAKALSGSCMLISRQVINTIGGLDPELFLSGDDADYSLRARMAGFRLYVAEDTFVHHHCHTTFKSLDGSLRKKFCDDSWSHFNKKWHRILSGIFSNKEPTWADLFVNEKPFYYGGLAKGRREHFINKQSR